MWETQVLRLYTRYLFSNQSKFVVVNRNSYDEINRGPMERAYGTR
jgi:hypothetical protein